MVREQCNFLCHHWDEALKQKGKSKEWFNLFATSKVKRSINTLKSAIIRERERARATDDVNNKEKWEAGPKDGESEQVHLWKKIMRFEEQYPNESALSPPGVEAYRAFSTLLGLTKQKGWITDDGLGTLMKESELAKLDSIFRVHDLAVKTNLLAHVWPFGQVDKAEVERPTPDYIQESGSREERLRAKGSNFE